MYQAHSLTSHLTFAAVALPLQQGAPRGVPLAGEGPHGQVADGEADDGGLVQLAGDGTGQGQHLGQLEELKVLLAPPGASSVTRLLLTEVLEAGGNEKEERGRREK